GVRSFCTLCVLWIFPITYLLLNAHFPSYPVNTTNDFVKRSTSPNNKIVTNIFHRIYCFFLSTTNSFTYSPRQTFCPVNNVTKLFLHTLPHFLSYFHEISF